MEPIKDDGRPVALVTGGTSGIGKATARMLAVRGWRVIAVGLGADENIPETQRLGHSELLTYEMDVTKPADITRILGALPRNAVGDQCPAQKRHRLGQGDLPGGAQPAVQHQHLGRRQQGQLLFLGRLLQ